MAELVNLGGDDGRGLVCYTRHKRSRDATPLLREEKKQKPEPGSLDSLPDECLYEILRRLPGHRERSIAACVSKPWLMLLSLIRPPEPNMAGIEEGINSTGRLTRGWLNESVTDVRVAAAAVGAARRGGLRCLMTAGPCRESPDTGLTDLGLTAVARCCPSLKELSMMEAHNITDAGLAELARGCPMIKGLHLWDCPLVTGRGLLAVDDKFTNLVSVSLHSCVSIDNEGLQAVGCCSPKLWDVSISGCPLIGDQGIAALMCSASSSLAVLKLHDLNVSDLAICAPVREHGECLQVLNLEGCNKLTDRVLVEISKHCKVLKEIDLSGADITDYGVALLASARQLNMRALSFAGCAKLTPRSLPLFRNMGTTLVSLNLKNCKLICEDDISSLQEEMPWCPIKME